MTNELKVINYINKQNIDYDNDELQPVYKHCGAIIVDSVLQAGLNYKNVVLPRVIHLIEKFKTFNTIEDFKTLIDIFGADNLVNLRNFRKTHTIIDIVNLLLASEVITLVQFQAWIRDETNAKKLMQINGVGPKTYDYMKKLLGIDALPIDRHLLRFVKRADVDLNSYFEIQKLYVNVAEKLGIKLVTLDKAIWKHMSNTY